jgi:hypothetical protein
MERSESIAVLSAFAGFKGYWTTVASYPWLWVSGDGQIASTKSGRAKILRGLMCGAYRAVSVRRKLKTYVHVLVCEAFHGPRPDGAQVRHLDGNRFNNTPSNLAWGTPQENSDDKRRHGTCAAGERNPMARLTLEIVSQMRSMRARTGMSYRRLGEMFGVSTMTAYRAVEGQSWR